MLPSSGKRQAGMDTEAGGAQQRKKYTVEEEEGTRVVREEDQVGIL